MKTLTIPQHIITPKHLTKPTSYPQIRLNRRETPFPPPTSWRLQSGAKGFTGSRKDKETTPRKVQTTRKNDEEDDDKIPEVVFERMIKRILFYVGVPLATGFVFLQIFSVLKEENLWDVPTWVSFLTIFVTFGTSALGIAFGSLSTSLDAEKDGSFLGLEQVEKNWAEMWKEENESGDS